MMMRMGVVSGMIASSIPVTTQMGDAHSPQAIERPHTPKTTLKTISSANRIHIMNNTKTVINNVVSSTSSNINISNKPAIMIDPVNNNNNRYTVRPPRPMANPRGEREEDEARGRDSGR